MSEHICHNGLIERIEKNVVFVRIVQQSACSGCHARSMCVASESKEKIIEVVDSSGTYRVDEEVIICGESSLGLQAVLLAFVFPLLLVLLAIIVGISQWEEPISALVALGLLIPYYTVLYLLRDRLKRRFVFTLKKTENIS
ncbi:SoxR reducing system RseC family protein [Parabacteroides sp. PF5-9]|uniref:SoxR reducing system RseC family protein n=1 Tax=Parabacteroides sp. PF5-9 TaxID=1742404 RepID=UPI00247656FB|nr:SoxR reducing system RseC family protein [Parabacteroides sp. PF5-9]MDH6356154.1 positive regulator of sigma E activity [Parabacteroides sp. PF5-9]